MSDYDPTIKKQLKVLRPKIENWLKQYVSEKRLEHIYNVAQTAKKYAKKLGFDHYKAELSAMLHDCAKEYTDKMLLDIAEQKKIELDEVDYKLPHVLHARVGAEIAREQFGISDPDVLGGIRCHTLAEPNMSKIMMIVYLADASEPKRDKKFAAPIRKTFKEKGLESAVLHAINSKLEYVFKENKIIHPLTIRARNWLLETLQ